MKKTLLAVALAAGFAGVAQAETSVTLYGLIDAGLGYNRLKYDGYKESRFGAVDGVNSGSRFGLRGSEDLGDGLKAVFQLEGGFSPNTGDHAQGGRMFGRQATIGLASESWGQLDFGRQTNLASKYFTAIDPFGLSYETANLGTVLGSANTMRLDNMVMYQTPSFSGLTLGIGYSFNANGSGNFRTNENNRVITAGAQYANGPLTVALSYDRLRPDSSLNRNEKIQQYNIGAAYDFEVVKVAAAFGQTRDGWFVTTDARGFPAPDFILADGARVNSYMLGATVPLGSSKVFASWQRADPKNRRLGDDVSMDVYSIGYTYDMSKRTNLYAYVSYADDLMFLEDLRSTAVAVGLRHRF